VDAPEGPSAGKLFGPPRARPDRGQGWPGFDEGSSVAVEIARSEHLAMGANMGKNCCGGNCCLGSIEGGGHCSRYEADFSLHTHSRLSRRTRSAQRRTARQIASRCHVASGRGERT
jgi:hypothetical protein